MALILEIIGTGMLNFNKCQCFVVLLCEHMHCILSIKLHMMYMMLIFVYAMICGCY